ncbi:Ankyrin repeat domain-containing protein 17 [Hondaea fermentalgiana]|uniref:Ankyrin repeat domain-containing protein 17 n=1 Tax=Hondaea fermentalgiana TaxID=2315210 RepID=A0A2R5GRL9_9STRA|nr:Ankyrin repeat domain-containing protein 17 [Hondaea fermentalgiana]|eukprot:GBG33245.1 Ankyrin repeat domain-containing protein 17 [Hondaea fermentalgiana]
MSMLGALQKAVREEVAGSLGPGARVTQAAAARAAGEVLQASAGAGEELVSAGEEKGGGAAREDVLARVCEEGRLSRVARVGHSKSRRGTLVVSPTAAQNLAVKEVELLVPDDEASALASSKASLRNRHKILRSTAGQVWKLKSNWIKMWKKQHLSVDANGLVYAKQANGQSQTHIPLDKIVTVALARPADVGPKVRLRPESFLVETRGGRTYVFASDALSSGGQEGVGGDASDGVRGAGGLGGAYSQNPYSQGYARGDGGDRGAWGSQAGEQTSVSGPMWCKIIASHVLLHAVQHGMSQERIAHFCDLGADLNCAWADGRQYPPLALAMQSGNVEVAKYLLRRGADPSCLLRWSFLMMDRIARPVDLLNMLIETKKDLNVCSDDPHGWTLLHYLAYEGDLESVQRLIARVDVPTIRAVNTLGDCSLMLALKKHGAKPGEVIENLCLALARNSDVTRHDKWNDTVLHVAIKQGHLALARKAISMGAKIEQRDAEGNTALHVAVKTRSFALARWMVERLASQEVQRKEVLDLRDERKGDTVLALALKLGEQDLALFFLRQGASPAIRSSSWDLTPDCASDSPLHIAIKMEMRELAEAMTAEGSPWGQQLLREMDTRGVPAVVLALRRSMLRLALQMIRVSRGDAVVLDAVTRKEGDTSLHVALERGLFLLACALVDAGASVNVQNRKGHTALHLCVDRLAMLGPVSARCERMVLLLMRGLLDRGADAALRSGSLEYTSLHSAVVGGQREAVALLLERQSALADMCDKDGNSGLALAVLRGEPALVQLLLDYGADVDVVSKASLSTLHLALQATPQDESRTAELCGLLLRHGAYPGIWDRSGRCPVHHMAARNLGLVVEALAAHCKVAGHLDLRTETGETAAMLAVTHGALDALNVLLAHGIDLDAKIPATRRGIFHIAGDLCVSRSEPFWSSGIPQRLLELKHVAKVYDRDVAGTSVVGAKSFIRRCLTSDGPVSPRASTEDEPLVIADPAQSVSGLGVASAVGVDADALISPASASSSSSSDSSVEDGIFDVGVNGCAWDKSEWDVGLAAALDACSACVVVFCASIAEREHLYDPELKDLYLSLPPLQRVEIVEVIKLEGKLVAQQWLMTPQGQARLNEDAEQLMASNPSLAPVQAQQQARQRFVESHLTSWFAELEILHAAASPASPASPGSPLSS